MGRVRARTDPDLLHETKQMLSLTLGIFERFLGEIIMEPRRGSRTDRCIMESSHLVRPVKVLSGW